MWKMVKDPEKYVLIRCMMCLIGHAQGKEKLALKLNKYQN